MKPKRRKGGGSKLGRTEIIQVRLDPKLRFAAELAAAKHRRALSSFAEWAIEQAVKQVTITQAHGATPMTAHDVTVEVWDVEEADRFAKLAFRFPELLTHDEEYLWKLISENGYLWRGRYFPPFPNEWSWSVAETNLYFPRLREHWDTFKKVAAGELGKEHLPQWEEHGPLPVNLSLIDPLPLAPKKGNLNHGT
jgi:hypothetical protein